jgi:O-antigen/teichoic acid export membrane protein
MDYKIAAARNVLWVTVGQICTRVLGMVFFLYLAFKLGDVAVGTFSFGFAFLGVWFSFGELGLFQYLARKWSHDATGWIDDFKAASTLKAITSAIILVVLIFYLALYDRHLWLELTLVFVALFLDQIRALQEIYFNAQDQFRTASLALLFERLVESVAGIIMLYLGFGLPTVLGIYIIGRLVAIAYQRLHQYFPYSLRLDRASARVLLRGGLPFLFLGVFSVIYFRIDMVMLRYLKDLQVVGWYSAAYRFVDLIGILPGIFATATFPLFVKLFRDKNSEGYKDLFQKTFKYSFIIGIGVVGIGSWVAHDIIRFFYPSDFAPAGRALQILLFASFLIFIDYLFIQLLTVQRRERTALAITGSAAIVNIVLNFLLIPRWSLYGSAGATVLTEVFMLCAALYFVQARPRKLDMLRAALALLPALAVLWALPQIEFILRAAIALAVYGVALFGTGAITRQEVGGYRALLGKTAPTLLPEEP